MSVLIVGFMCSGKSHIGRLVAQRLGLPHLDTDRLVEAEVGPLLPWMRLHGEVAFRERESAVLSRVLEGPPAVVSTGGGTPCEGDAMDRMLRAGTVVYLDVPMDLLIERCARKGGDRPLLFGLQGDTLAERVRSLMERRAPVYRRAQMHVHAADAPDVLAERIAKALEPGYLDQVR
jgi:shikimate kinase